MQAPRPDAVHPCFQRPAPGEVVAAGRKLVGSAQLVERHAVLQHGSILLSGTQDAVLSLQGAGSGGAGGEVTLAELLGEPPPWPRLLGALRDAFARTLGIRLAPAVLEPVERSAVASELQRFGSDSWTWRR
jgi:lipoate-protein ligase A